MEELLRVIESEKLGDEANKVLAEFYAEKYVSRLDIERAGHTPDCLTIPVFFDYSEGRISKRSKERYDAHIAECADCTQVMDTFKKDAKKHPFRFVVRRAISLPYRFVDAIHERHLAQLGPQQHRAVGYR